MHTRIVVVSENVPYQDILVYKSTKKWNQRLLAMVTYSLSFILYKVEEGAIFKINESVHHPQTSVRSKGLVECRECVRLI